MEFEALLFGNPVNLTLFQDLMYYLRVYLDACSPSRHGSALCGSAMKCLYPSENFFNCLVPERFKKYSISPVYLKNRKERNS